MHTTEEGLHELLCFRSDDTEHPTVVPTVAVATRPSQCIRVILPARGQVNRVAGVWSPHWMPACVVYYHPGRVRVSTPHSNGSKEVVFSVVFKYKRGAQGLVDGHIMDFFSVSNVPTHYTWDDTRADYAGEDSLGAFIDDLRIE